MFPGIEENVSFYSGWNIDKLLIPKQEIPYSLPTYNSTQDLVDLSGYEFTNPPKVMALFSENGVDWYLSGGGILFDDLKPVLEITNTLIRIRSYSGFPMSGTAKIWVFDSRITQ